MKNNNGLDYLEKLIEEASAQIVKNFYEEIERFIKLSLSSKIYPPIKKIPNNFWLKIMLWIRGVKIKRTETVKYTFIEITQFGEIVSSKKFTLGKND